MEVNWQKTKKIHFTGIKGVAMTALAILAIEQGKQVSGTDTEEDFPTSEMLAKVKIKPLVEFKEEYISKLHPDLLIYTGAHGGKDNLEVQAAVRMGIPVLAHGQALGLVMSEKRQITVTGSHGKTTTSALFATVLNKSGRDASYAVGCGEIFGLGLPGHAGKGEYFVAEGDEYLTDPGHDATIRFFWQKPEILVVTNLDFDHPDAYASLEDVQKAFLRLQQQQVGQKLSIVNLDDPASQPLLTGATNVVTYGFSPRADYQITHVGIGIERTFVQLKEKNMPGIEFTLKIPGTHNALNSVAVAAACRTLGLSWPEIKSGLLEFGGTKRRFEKLAEVKEVIYYDDYAHHPQEILATIKAARTWQPKHRLIVVFQSHTYSRTKSLLPEFGQALSYADLVLITDIFPSARETDNLGISGKTLTEEVLKSNPQAVFTPGPGEIVSYLAKQLKPNDLVIFMGAGNIYNWEKPMIEKLSQIN